MLEKLMHKYVFFDLDGTLAEYRFNDHVSGGNVRCGQTFEELFFSEIFLESRPLKTMQGLVAKLNSDKIYVLGAITTNHEAKHKYKWLKEHYPNIKESNYIFVGDASLKVVALDEYSKKYNINKEDIVFIDDKHETLRIVEDAGYIAYHITSFME